MSLKILYVEVMGIANSTVIKRDIRSGALTATEMDNALRIAGSTSWAASATTYSGCGTQTTGSSLCPTRSGCQRRCLAGARLMWRPRCGLPRRCSWTPPSTCACLSPCVLFRLIIRTFDRFKSFSLHMMKFDGLPTLHVGLHLTGPGVLGIEGFVASGHSQGPAPACLRIFVVQEMFRIKAQ